MRVCVCLSLCEGMNVPGQAHVENMKVDAGVATRLYQLLLRLLPVLGIPANSNQLSGQDNANATVPTRTFY